MKKTAYFTFGRADNDALERVATTARDASIEGAFYTLETGFDMRDGAFVRIVYDDENEQDAQAIALVSAGVRCPCLT